MNKIIIKMLMAVSLSTLFVACLDDDKNKVVIKDEIDIPVLDDEKEVYKIEGKVWDDSNKDGRINSTEEGLKYSQIELYTLDGLKIKTLTTNKNGRYEFKNIDKGTYRIRLVKIDQGKLTTSNNIELKVESNLSNINFGLFIDDVKVYKIEGKVWDDNNKDGKINSQEEGLAYIEVELYTVAGSKIKTATTNKNGRYEFKNIDKGTYRVGLVKIGERKLTTSNNIELKVESNFSNVNFGLFKSTEIVLNGVTINEVLAANASINLDPDYKQFSDWIELYNNEDKTIDISGYYLSDDLKELEKWYIPKGTKIPAHSYLVIWADNEYDKQRALHTNFKLSQKGEGVFLSNKNGVVIDSITFPKQEGDISCAKVDNKIVYMNPTPNAKNSESTLTLKRAKKPKFSLDSGFYNATEDLVLSQKNNADIYYTTDGSIPTKNSKKYTQKININKTMVVRSIAIEKGSFVSSINNRTYLINENITLPVVSIAINDTYLNDDNIGIYKNYNESWMRAGSVEYIKDGESKFSENVGIRIFGGQTRKFAQKSLAIFAKNKFGEKSIKYPLFPDKQQIKKVKSFVLRNSGNDWGYTMMRDGLMHNIVKGEMDIDYQSYHATVVFLNGKYWGIHNLREKTNTNYIEANHGVDSKEIDLLAEQYEVQDGSNKAYKALLKYIENNSLTEDNHYAYVESQIDINEYINYMMVQIYGGNIDWPYANIKYWREQSTSAKWRWILYDTDRAFEDANRDSFDLVLEPNGLKEPNPSWSTFLFRSLMENSTFKEKFISTFQKHLNSTFKSERIDAIIVNMKNKLKPEIQRHFRKWGRRNETDWEHGNSDSIAQLKQFALERGETIERLMFNRFNIN